MEKGRPEIVQAKQECSKVPEPKIEGELSLDELNEVVGGTFAGPIYNGTYYPRFKSRFGSTG